MLRALATALLLAAVIFQTGCCKHRHRQLCCQPCCNTCCSAPHE